MCKLLSIQESIKVWEEISQDIARVAKANKQENKLRKKAEYAKQWRLKNKEKIARQIAAPERKAVAKKCQDEWRSENRERVNALERKYYYERQLSKIEKILEKSLNVKK